MGMLMYLSLKKIREQEEAQNKVEKPVEVPKEDEKPSEPVKKTGGRRKVNK